MPVYEVSVSYQTTASSSVKVLIEADSEAEAKEKGEYAVEKKWQDVEPRICAQCSGWGQVWNMDLGEWEPDMGEFGTTVTLRPDKTAEDMDVEIDEDGLEAED